MKSQPILPGQKTARFGIALIAGGLAWWLTRSVVSWWWTLGPVLVVLAAVVTRRTWVAWCVWHAATIGSIIQLVLRLRTLAKFSSAAVVPIAMTCLFIILSAAICALVLSCEFPRQTTTLLICLAVMNSILHPEPAWIAVAGLALLTSVGILAAATVRKRPLPETLSRVLPLLAVLIALALAATFLPVSRSPVQNQIAMLFQSSSSPGKPSSSGTGSKTSSTENSSKEPIVHSYYTTSILQLWFRVLERSLLPWAVPLVLGPLSIIIGMIVLSMLTHSSAGHILHMLILPLCILGGIVAAAILSSHLKLQNSATLLKLLQQWNSVWRLNHSQSLVNQAIKELPQSLPRGLQIGEAIMATVATVAMIVIVSLVLVKTAFELRFSFLHSIADPHERRRVATAIRHIATLDDTVLLDNPREAVIALFYLGVAALQKIGLTLSRGETPAELTRRVQEHCNSAGDPFALLATNFYIARYSEQTVTPEAALSSRASYRELLAAVNHADASRSNTAERSSVAS